MDVKAFLDRVEMIFGVKGATRLARALGVPQGRVEGWYARLSPDMIFIIDKLTNHKDVDIGWLITGNVTQREHDQRVARLEGQIQLLEKQLADAQKGTFLTAAREACSTVVNDLGLSPMAREGSHSPAADAHAVAVPKK